MLLKTGLESVVVKTNCRLDRKNEASALFALKDQSLNENSCSAIKNCGRSWKEKSDYSPKKKRIHQLSKYFLNTLKTSIEQFTILLYLWFLLIEKYLWSPTGSKLTCGPKSHKLSWFLLFSSHAIVSSKYLRVFLNWFIRSMVGK